MWAYSTSDYQEKPKEQGGGGKHSKNSAPLLNSQAGENECKLVFGNTSWVCDAEESRMVLPVAAEGVDPGKCRVRYCDSVLQTQLFCSQTWAGSCQDFQVSPDLLYCQSIIQASHNELTERQLQLTLLYRKGCYINIPVSFLTRFSITISDSIAYSGCILAAGIHRCLELLRQSQPGPLLIWQIKTIFYALIKSE